MPDRPLNTPLNAPLEAPPSRRPDAHVPGPSAKPDAMPANEPVLDYLPGSRERSELKAELQRQEAQPPLDIPLIISGREVRTGNTITNVIPHRHAHVLANIHQAGEREVHDAITAALEAHRQWSRTPAEERAAIFLRAADLLAGPWRQRINAATMLNQSKTAFQAEIDAACELIDFFRFNVHFMRRIMEIQPLISPPGVTNTLDTRPLEGFVYAVSPFNFTSIGGNLPSAPAVMGNVVLWKPSPWALYSNYLVMRLLMEAGLPPGVINFIPGDAEALTRQIVAHPEFAGIHYTGSTAVFRSIQQKVAGNLDTLRQNPRMVGETGGKDFLVAHPSADPDALVTALIRGAFELQGQKCSALSRAYIAESLWSKIYEPLIEQIESVKVGDVSDFTTFMGALIHRRALDKCRRYYDEACNSHLAHVLAGGRGDDGLGYFFPPTLIQADDPRYPSMCEEIFGPILTVHVFPDRGWSEAVRLCNETSPYGLTGAVFANDRAAVDEASRVLRFAAGNFYINDKPTGAVVGQQPFGGSRASGTNDKAGGIWNLLRWVSPRVIKENLKPPHDYRYGSMAEP